MGRSLHVYAIPDKIEHDKAKTICMGLDYERTSDEALQCLHSHLKGNTVYASYREESSAAKKAWDENQPYSWDHQGRHKLSDAWCLWCAVFADGGLYASAVVKDSVNFRHSYSNPIWRSDWHFYNMHPGRAHSDLVNRFDNQRMYRQLDDTDVEDIERSVESLGTVYRTVDKEALGETLEAIGFFKRWLGEPGIAVIYESEA